MQCKKKETGKNAINARNECVIHVTFRGTSPKLDHWPGLGLYPSNVNYASLSQKSSLWGSCITTNTFLQGDRKETRVQMEGEIRIFFFFMRDANAKVEESNMLRVLIQKDEKSCKNLN